MTDADLAGAEQWARMNPHLTASSGYLKQLVAEVKRLRDKQTELNRRATNAEGEAATHCAERHKAWQKLQDAYELDRRMSEDLRIALKRPNEGGLLLPGLIRAIIRELEASELLTSTLEGSISRLARERDDAIAGKEAADQAVDSLMTENGELKNRLGEALRDLWQANTDLEDTIVSVRYLIRERDQFSEALDKTTKARDQIATAHSRIGFDLADARAHAQELSTIAGREAGQRAKLQRENADLDRLNRELSNTCVELRAKAFVSEHRVIDIDIKVNGKQQAVARIPVDLSKS